MTSIQPRPSLPVLMSLIDRLAVFDDEDLGDAGEPDDRIEGNDGRPCFGVGDDRGFGEAAGAEQTTFVGDKVSTWNVRQGESTEGLMRATLPSMATPRCARVESRTRLADSYVFRVLLGDLAPETDRVFDHELATASRP